MEDLERFYGDLLAALAAVANIRFVKSSSTQVALLVRLGSL